MLIALTIPLFSQTSVQTFGVANGVHASGVSTSFVPTPNLSGSTYVRIGTGTGTINLQPALVSPNFGTEKIVRCEAATATSVNKISPIVGYTPSNQFYTRFQMLLGNNVGGNSGATDGQWYFFQGDGTNFSDANAFSGAQVFTGLQFTFGAGGAITTSYRNGSTWTSLGSILSQGNVYTVEIMGNNTASTINYTYGTAQTVATNTFDLWINGVLVGNDLAKALLANVANISSMMFYGVSSTANAANLFLDNISVTNSIPANVCNTIAAPVVTASPDTICVGASSNLNGVSAGNKIKWYTQSVGGSAIDSNLSGVNFPVTPAVTTKYYVEAESIVMGAPITTTFNYTGALQTFVVPAGVTSVSIEAYGAQGGSSEGGAPGGLGGYATGSLSVNGGDVLNIYVGGTGIAAVSVNSFTGGYNGGGSGGITSAANFLPRGGGGGGASDVRIGGWI